jgi:hypothetical protein
MEVRWRCDECGLDFNGPTQLKDHLRGRKHEKKMRRRAAGDVAAGAIFKKKKKSEVNIDHLADKVFTLTLDSRAAAAISKAALQKQRSSRSRSRSLSQGRSQRQNRSGSRSHSVESGAWSFGTRSHRSSSVDSDSSGGTFRTYSCSGYSSDDSMASSSDHTSLGGDPSSYRTRGGGSRREFKHWALHKLARVGVLDPQPGRAEVQVLKEIGVRGDNPLLDESSMLKQVFQPREGFQNQDLIEITMLIGGNAVPTVTAPGEGMKFEDTWEYALVPAGCEGLDYVLLVANNTGCDLGIELVIDGQLDCKNWPVKAYSQKERKGKSDRYYNCSGYQLQPSRFESLNGAMIPDIAEGDEGDEDEEEDDRDSDDDEMGDAGDQQWTPKRLHGQMQTAAEFHLDGETTADTAIAMLKEQPMYLKFADSLPGAYIEAKAFVSQWKKQFSGDGSEPRNRNRDSGQPTQQASMLASRATEKVCLSTGYGVEQPLARQAGGGRLVRLGSEPLATKRLVYRPAVQFQVLKFFHGTSWDAASRIEREGFIKSEGGRLGAGVYVAREEKARKFAENRDRHGGSEGGLLEVQVVVRNPCFIASEEDPRCGTWQRQGFDACRTDETGVSSNMEWCILDRRQVTVIRIHKIPLVDFAPILGYTNINLCGQDLIAEVAR